MKYHYKIECLGGCITAIDTDDVIGFDMTKAAIELNDDNKNMQTILNTRNVVRIERTLNKGESK